jgi:hypothetical protein
MTILSLLVNKILNQEVNLLTEMISSKLRPDKQK